jgi:hypothetical protein
MLPATPAADRVAPMRRRGLLSCVLGGLVILLVSAARASTPIALDAPKSSAAVAAASAFNTAAVVLYQPDPVLKERLPGIDELATFTKAIQDAAATAFPAGSTERELDIVVAITPGRRARFWLVSAKASDADAPLLSGLRSFLVPAVQNGPVAFAVIGSISGAPTSAVTRPFKPPMPDEWRAAAERSPEALIPDGILQIVWPD